MLQVLLEQIGEMPPHDMIANAQLKAWQLKEEREKISTAAEIGVKKGKVRKRKPEDG